MKCLIFLIGTLSPILANADNSALTKYKLFVAPWIQWDVEHYVNIARYGYSASIDRLAIVFFPFFPLCTRFLNKIMGGPMEISALLLSNLGSTIGLFLFYKLTRLDFNEEDSWAALVLILIFPAAYFFNAPYTEGPFLALTVGSFYSARKKQWCMAGLCGQFAAMTRIPGIFIFPALLIEFLQQRREEKTSWKQGFWLLLIPLGLIAYLAINKITLGSPWAFQSVQKTYWNKQLAWPWQATFNLVRFVLRSPFNEMWLVMGLAELTATAIMIIGTIVSCVRLRLSYALYAALHTLLILSSNFMVSVPRYVIAIFPLFLTLSALRHHKIAFTLWVFFSVQLLAVFTMGFTLGHWTF